MDEQKEEVIIEGLPKPREINNQYKGFPTWKKNLVAALAITGIGLIVFYLGYSLGWNNCLVTLG